MFRDFKDAAPPKRDDWTIPQNWAHFTREDHRVWDLLFARQQQRLAGRAVRAFEQGLDLLRLDRPGIPEFDALNDRLFPRTGWRVVPVPGLLPDEIFFRHLSRRQFPAGNFIRSAAQLDYLEEPDVFHDVFGHVPMLADPRVADVLEELGHQGLAALGSGHLPLLSRLYWYTIEFGLAREDGVLKIYGAGLASSYGEAGFALEDAAPWRRPFDLTEVLATPYRSDAFQRGYFVIPSFEALLETLAGADLAAAYAAAEALS
ncbi:MAG: phenylalanine-4-hydroxylase [Thermoleophilaceae bacterium]|nr:phenylalanine-4-hydroxylase [Thermoleophilaceae bacterium]